MKAAVLLLGMIFTAPLFASDMSLSFKDHVEVKKVVLDETLLIELYKLPTNSLFDGERMIAGQFEISKKKKKSYLETLRSKLTGSQISRF